ncbi:hypothetical protein KY331_03280 [Candidatus Woesearchaeota archaeon]|nr:hypothetical protein [Candidatus Woesearchaeota archaeon]
MNDEEFLGLNAEELHAYAEKKLEERTATAEKALTPKQAEQRGNAHMLLYKASIALAEMNGKPNSLEYRLDIERMELHLGVLATAVRINDKDHWKMINDRSKSGLKKLSENPWFKKAYDQAHDATAKFFDSQVSGIPDFRSTVTELFPESYELVAGLVDKRIEDLETITLTTNAGRKGGGVGRFNYNGQDCVFKLEKDFLPSYKATMAASIIHERAETDGLAARLARRIPKSLHSEPIPREGYWVGFFEDITNKIVVADEADLEIMQPELDKGLDYEIIDNLYTIALYHEVLTAAMNEKIDPFLEVEKSPTNLSKKEIIERFKSNPEVYEQVKGELHRLLEGYDERNVILATHEIRGNTMGHYDNKPDENRKNGHLLDCGSTKRGVEVDDVAREFGCRPDVFLKPELCSNYIDAFVRMRQRINPNYQPAENLKNLVYSQISNRSLRSAGWNLEVNDIVSFKRHWETAKILSMLSGYDVLDKAS